MRIATCLAGLLLAVATSANAQQADGKLTDFLKDTGTVFVLENARLIDGTGGAARDNMTVVIENGRITRVGPARAKERDGAKRIVTTCSPKVRHTMDSAEGAASVVERATSGIRTPFRGRG